MDKGLLDMLGLTAFGDVRESPRHVRRRSKSEQKRALFVRLAYLVPLAATIGLLVPAEVVNGSNVAGYLMVRAQCFFGAFPVCWLLLRIGRATWLHYLGATAWIMFLAVCFPLFTYF